MVVSRPTRITQCIVTKWKTAGAVLSDHSNFEEEQENSSFTILPKESE